MPVMNVLSTVLALVLVAGGQSAAKPNFSGEWKMNASKSDFGGLPPPESVIRRITHAEPSLTIVEEQRGGMGDQTATRKYVTDGTPTSFSANGADVTTSATWTETTLVVVSTVSAIGLTFNDKMSLSADGKTLTSSVRLNSPQGDLDITLVFDRQ
jgi:hypothetical protein